MKYLRVALYLVVFIVFLSSPLSDLFRSPGLGSAWVRTEGKFVAFNGSTISFNLPVELSCRTTGSEFLIGQNPSKDGSISIDFIGANVVTTNSMINCSYKSLNGLPAARYVTLPIFIQFCFFGVGLFLILKGIVDIFKLAKK